MKTRRRKAVRRGFLWALGVSLSACLLSVFISESAVRSAAAGQCYTHVEDIPQNDVGLVLGTSKWVRGHKLNRYYTARIEAAATLWKKGKVRKLLVSGDNRRIDYNEPKAMKDDLIAAGVPKNSIVCDYAGIRTLDSMARASRVFGQERVTVISQRFHNERAIYLGKQWGVEAVGFDAECPPLSGRLQLREVGARLNALWDNAVGTKPRHLGDKITI
jgi:SanA protein